MKKFIILVFSLFIVSCSNDNNSSSEPENIEGTILKSYKEDSPNGNIHLFENEGSRYEKIVFSTGEILIKFAYDSNNKMTKTTVSPDSNPSTTTFTYNNDGQIIKMEKDNRKLGTEGKLFVWLFSYNNNVVTGELVSDQDPNFNHIKVQYTFNNEGLLISKHDYVDYPAKENRPIRTNSYITLKYDNNKNLVLLKMTQNGTHDLPDSPASLYVNTATYEYDDKPNPVHKVYMNHYMNYILSNEYPFVLERGSIQDRVTGTGTNNLIRTTYSNSESGGIPVDNVYKNIYTYQLNNLPSKMARISTVDNKKDSGLIFNYSAK
ncbi:hypothetical protein [Flavobacterium johnsoniae]|uniref:DUF4595 domain-containing protein n=1 Tax=Flavobacterium johnsoniae TaxID=986 RepID=A0A1J7BTI4_FLAJO|nr:hypothetical protein [Flavobacterium johnsoniae]OIV42014.1 hypothetical protein BKM63_10200 [Flavobacterium johnsoniae]